MLTFNEDKHRKSHQRSRLIHFIFLKDIYEGRNKNLILFLLYTILKNELFSKSPSRQHNVHTVPPTVTESPGFGTQPGSPKASWSHI